MLFVRRNKFETDYQIILELVDTPGSRGKSFARPLPCRSLAEILEAAAPRHEVAREMKQKSNLGNQPPVPVSRDEVLRTDRSSDLLPEL